MSKDNRLRLQRELEGYLEGEVTTPSDHVSFQPDEKSKIAYPHLVYSRAPAYKVKADNRTYLSREKFTVTFIHRNPDSPVFDVLAERPYSSHQTSFVVDGLHHDVFDLYL